MQVILENNTTHFKQYYDNVECKTGKLYTELDIDVSNLEDGEYTLFLMNNSNEIISRDLVKIGEYKNKVYNTGRKFIQYGK